jgi:PAS domain S-box-containing protein
MHLEFIVIVLQMVIIFLLIRYLLSNYESLSDSKRRFQQIIENSPIGYFRIGLDAKWQYVNPTWEKMHGYKLDEIIGKSFEYTQTEKNLEESKSTVKRVLSGETLIGEFDGKNEDGSIGYHNYYVQPIFSNSKIVAIEGFIVDITTCKNIEHEIKEAHKQLLSIFNSIDELIYVCDPKTYTILFVNDAVKKITKNRTGEKCFQLFQNKNPPCSFCTNSKIFDKNLGKTYIWNFHNKVSNRYYKCIDRAIKWSNGNYVRCEIAINTTTNHNTLIKLEKANINLRKLTKNMNMKIEEEKKTLSRDIHDGLGQLFTTMKFSLSSLTKGNEINEAYIKEINDLITMTQKGVELTRNICRNLRPSLLDNLGLKEAVIEYSTNFSKLTNILCHCNFQPENFIINKELSLSIYRIIIELFTNVARHSKADLIILDFSLFENQLILRFEDNGIGITTEQIFSSCSLGLIGIRERLRSWNGNLSIERNKPIGTQVIIRIPGKQFSVTNKE